MPEYQITIEQSDAVGSGVGETLRMKSWYAVLVALLANAYVYCLYLLVIGHMQRVQLLRCFMMHALFFLCSHSLILKFQST